MFSDLVGSTALSARMDSEDIREGSAYQKCVAETDAARRRPRRVMGVLVYFGYYQAHEDGREGRARTAQAGHCSKQSKEPRSRRHALKIYRP